MANFYRIKIDSIYLTQTGLAGGLPCFLQVTGADALLQTRTGQITQSADGTPYAQIVEFTSGKVLEIQIDYLEKEIWEIIVASFNSAMETGATINVVGTGDVGDFDVDAMPLLPKPFEAKEFSFGRVKNAVFRFITV